jgi:hypothetical protein
MWRKVAGRPHDHAPASAADARASGRWALGRRRDFRVTCVASGCRGCGPMLVERPGTDARIEAMVGEVRVARSGGRASQPGLLTEVPGEPLEEGHDGRSALVSPSTWRTGGRVGPRHACASGGQPGRETVALLVLSGRAWRGHRPDDRVRYSSSGHVNQQLLLGVLPRLRHGVGCAASFATGDERLHREACAAHRSAARSMATRAGTRPRARPKGCPSCEQRIRECRRYLTDAHPSHSAARVGGRAIAASPRAGGGAPIAKPGLGPVAV